MDMQTLYLIVPLAPLFGAIVAGLFGRLVGRTGAHVVTIAGVAVSFIASVLVFQDVRDGNTFNGTVYTWMALGDLRFEVGFLIDALTAMMMLVVTFVSLMVHIYTIGYMHDDPGYQRFFSYISLFTFSMLMLVMSNNFLQLFFGWEAVGLVSYLLIGFWYTKETAIYANLKAFLVNRVGDFGFILGIGLVLAYFGSLDYATVFAKAPSLARETITLWPDTPWMLMTVIGILLFIGAMGKSAQFPLHVWLPDSMEGPTPISALIHAATMVTAGIFMVARMSPLYELSDVALSFIMVIGAITALFMGFLGIVQNDIKRVVAYSTLSQLGYMTVALGASAYSVAVFHLMTHAFFKALLFLAAGSVIIAMHHNQDIRYMGGLKKYMPITWITSLIGSLALIGTPFLSGFYSKETIIEAVKLSNLPVADIAYWAVLIGVFVTAFYSFRMYFLVFHGKERFHQGHAHGNEPDAHHDEHHGGTPHETPWVVTGPLLALALPSLAIGYMTIESMLFGDFFGRAIYVADRHPVMHELNQHFHGAAAMGLHAVVTLPFWLAVAGVGLAAFFYLKRPDIPAAIAQRFKFLHQMLLNKYWFDELYSWMFARGARFFGGFLWRRGDQNVIDGFFVNGTAHLVERFSRLVKAFQSGYIYHYAFAMLIGVFALVTWFARLN
ncbi:MAG: NADH-quinone oxidoreductase subunit L [Thiobacillus sp. GWE1_62_9]|nr:MAG: NADH-quinone oxidoreductase subunit L [Thiobacillus sp. GWE1_62_9]